MTTRCKFKVVSMTRGQGYVSITAAPVYSTDPNHENKAFWDATPSGELKLQVTNTSLDPFPPGLEFYIDLTPAPAVKA